MRVEHVSEASEEIVDALRHLIPQLSSSSPPPDRAAVGEIVSSPSTELLVARSDDEAVVGTLTLALIRIPTGMRAWIEDVVVDADARGSGVGAALVDEAIRLAEARGAQTIDLTSRPDRVEANRLYVRSGFAPRETNVYRRPLS